MSAPRRFRVYVVEWTSWKTYLEADSEEAATEAAQKLWDEEGPEAFGFGDAGIDDVSAYEIASGGDV